MSPPYFASHRPMDRRYLLRGAGVAPVLPFLNFMAPAQTPGIKPRRKLVICNNLGLLADQFFPAESGRDYIPSPSVKLLQEPCNDYTVLAGVSHHHAADSGQSRRPWFPQEAQLSWVAGATAVAEWIKASRPKKVSARTPGRSLSITRCPSVQPEFFPMAELSLASGDLWRLLLTDDRKLARNLAQQQTVYATGALERYSGRAQIEQILPRAKTDQYGLRSIVHRIAQSDLFRDSEQSPHHE